MTLGSARILESGRRCETPHADAPKQTGSLKTIYASCPEPKIALYVFSTAGRPLPVMWHSFSALLRQGSSLDQAMNQPVSGSPVVTHHLGALIALGTLLAINLAWMSKFFFGWW